MRKTQAQAAQPEETRRERFRKRFALYRFLRALVYPLFALIYPFQILGRENLPKDDVGPVLLYANHRSWLDPVLLLFALRRPISFMAKEELFRVPVISWLLNAVHAIPIRRGYADVAAVKEALRVLRSGGQFCIFPEGTRNKDPKIPMLPFFNGAVVLADKTKALMVPVIIHSQYRLFSRSHIVVGKSLSSEALLEEVPASPEESAQSSHKQDLERMNGRMREILLDQWHSSSRLINRQKALPVCKAAGHE